MKTFLLYLIEFAVFFCIWVLTAYLVEVVWQVAETGWIMSAGALVITAGYPFAVMVRKTIAIIINSKQQE